MVPLILTLCIGAQPGGFNITPGFTINPGTSTNFNFVIAPEDVTPKPDEKEVAPFPVPVPTPVPKPVVEPKTKDCKCDPICACDPCVCGQPKDASVKIAVGNGSCSATSIAYHNGQSLIITVSHLFRGDNGQYYQPGTKVSVTTEAGEQFDGELVAIHPTSDIALAIIKGKIPTASFNLREPLVGEQVQQWGYNYLSKGKQVYKTGIVIKISDYNGTMDSSIDQISGESGVGVFNLSGRIVAVAWGGGPNLTKGQASTRLKIVRAFVARLADRFPALRPQVTSPPTKPKNVNSAVKAPEGWYTDYNEAVKAAEESGKPLVTVFSADAGCHYCDVYKSSTLKDKSLLNEAVCVYVTRETYNNLFDVMGIKGWPHTLVAKVGERAVVVESISGVTNINTLRAAINKAKH